MGEERRDEGGRGEGGDISMHHCVSVHAHVGVDEVVHQSCELCHN